jgi:uncharacterized protein
MTEYFDLSKDSVYKTEKMIQASFSVSEGSHDWNHIHRVRQMAVYLCDKEGGDRFLVEMAALLHDLEDWKYTTSGEAPGLISRWLQSLGIHPETENRILTIINEVSYKGSGVVTPCSSKESEIVQDADRLDAMGAIGIARAFAYGGSRGRALYAAESEPVNHLDFETYKKNQGPTLNHFYEKLLLLKDRMNTSTARPIAAARHQYMLDFLDQFKKECDL